MDSPIKKCVERKDIDEITILGGEPSDQAEGICNLINLLNFNVDILVFSGYFYDEIKDNCIKKMLRGKADILIDGENADY